MGSRSVTIRCKRTFCAERLLLRSTAGFTLIELLLALLIFGIIAGVIFASFAAVVDGVERGRQSVEVYRLGRTALQRMAQEISAAVWFAGDARTTLLGVNDEVAGQARDRITFLTVPYRRFVPNVPENALCDVSYFITDNAQGKPALFREEDCTPDAERFGDGTRLELTDTAVALDITYYDAEGEHESWPPHEAEEGPLPCRVRLALTLQDTRQQGRVFITTVRLPLRETCEEVSQR